MQESGENTRGTEGRGEDPHIFNCSLEYLMLQATQKSSNVLPLSDLHRHPDVSCLAAF